MSRFRNKKKKGSIGSFFYIILFLIVTAGGSYGYITWFEGDIPQIKSTKLPAYIGRKTNLSFVFFDRKSGIRSITVSIIQGNKSQKLFSKQFHKSQSKNIQPKERVNIEINPGKLGLKEGTAKIKVTVFDHSFRNMMKGNGNELVHKVIIDTKAPKISIIHSERYIVPGGAGIVIYSIDDTEKHGIMFNGVFHPGFPLIDESEKKYISYIALPYFAKNIGQAEIVAEDAAGNKSVKRFAPIFKKPKQKHDRINVSDGFLSKKIPEFEEHYPEMKGTMIQKYIFANSKIRVMNNKTIHDLCLNPGSKQLWSGRFLRMAGSGKAGFADHRTYYYKGKAIDKQVHLGMDIASTRHANIKAAGTGKVIFADYLGIYGNMVMLDHGQGVFSLYSHLSQINVTVGEELEKGNILALSGTSGMAGGDHLHFSMLINGIFVTPIEWWDQHWIDVTIDGPMVDAKF